MSSDFRMNIDFKDDYYWESLTSEEKLDLLRQMIMGDNGTPVCPNCSSRTIKWFNQQVFECYHCSNCGKDIAKPTPTQEEEQNI